MGSFLEDNIFILEEMIDLQPEYENHNAIMSLWVKEKDLIRPSTDITLLKKLEPGIYTAEYNRDIGYFCKQLKSSSDELFIFSDTIVQDLLDEISTFWEKKDLYKENKLLHKRGVLLSGFAGTGKSSIVSLLSKEVISNGGVVFIVSSPSNLQTYLGFVKSGFRKIQPDTPIITVIEDIDQYEDVELELLDFLDGKTNIEHHVLIATSNNTEDLPDTFLRPSRLDLNIEIPLPSEGTRREYFKFKSVSEELIPKLVDKTEDCSLADLKEIYICVFLLGYEIEDAIKKVTCPRDKKNYLSKSAHAKKIGL